MTLAIQYQLQLTQSSHYATKSIASVMTLLLHPTMYCVGHTMDHIGQIANVCHLRLGLCHLTEIVFWHFKGWKIKFSITDQNCLKIILEQQKPFLDSRHIVGGLVASEQIWKISDFFFMKHSLITHIFFLLTY